MNLNQQLQAPAPKVFNREHGASAKAASQSLSLRSSQLSESLPSSAENGFHDLGIVPNIMKEIDRLRFDSPTPIQRQSIPAGIQGEDIIAIARTGSGKTLAFGIPMLQRLSQNLSQRNNKSRSKGAGLVLVPTRELAIQVEESLRTISRSTRLSSVVLIGGAPMIPQQNALRRNPGIIIATPGRLVDHIERGTAKLSNIEVFVLDEADRMLDMGFLPDIRKVMKALPTKRQMMLFSATMPKEIEAIAKKMMENPTRIEIDRSGIIPTEVSQEMFYINNQDKSRLLSVQLKECSGPVLVFTRTKRMATKLTTRVNKMGFAAAEIHSNRSLGQRRHALEGFKRGKFQVLVATDIAARGIDVSGIELVVNYDMPANSEDYVHRIGRTGRAGKTGHAISYANVDQKGSIRSLERFMKAKLTVSTLPILPSEKFLLQEAEKAKSQTKPSRERGSTSRESTGSRSVKNSYSRRDNFRSNESQRSNSRKFAAKRSDSDRASFRKNRSKRSPSERQEAPAPHPATPNSLSQILESAESNQNASSNEKSFWSTFKKKRLTKKKSVGQGTGRKKHSKRK